MPCHAPHWCSCRATAFLGLQMERFREESRQEEQRRATAVTAREEAEQKFAELEAAFSEKAAALQAVEEESEAKAAQAAEQVRSQFRISSPSFAPHLATRCNGNLSVAQKCKISLDMRKMLRDDMANSASTQAAAGAREQAATEAGAATAGAGAAKGAESDGEGPDLQVPLTNFWIAVAK